MMATENRRSTKKDQQLAAGEDASAIDDIAPAAGETQAGESAAETAAPPAAAARTSRPRTRSSAGASKKAAALQNTAKAKTSRPRGRPRKEVPGIAPGAGAPGAGTTVAETAAQGTRAAAAVAQGTLSAGASPPAGSNHQTGSLSRLAIAQGDPAAGHFGVDALYSVYKGRAIVAEITDGAVASFDFLDLSAVQPQQLMFDDAVQQQIATALWTPIVKTAECRAAGLPLKQGIVLSGLAGTGKTFTALATAKKCVDAGWTFMMVSDAAGLPQALSIAERYYQPCVVFTEDVDVSFPTFTAWRSAFSGISAGAEIVTLSTTSDHVAPALAPGWIDSVIYLTPPSGEVVKKLIRMYGGTCLREDDQLVTSSGALSGYSPAAIKLAVERCIRYAVGRASARTKPHVADKQIAEMASQLSQLGPVATFNAYPHAAETQHQQPAGWSPEEFRRVAQATLQEYIPHASLHAMDRMLREQGELMREISERLLRITAGGGAPMATRGVPARAAV